jgi:hypothetical protein
MLLKPWSHCRAAAEVMDPVNLLAFLTIELAAG